MAELTQPMREAALGEGKLLVAKCAHCGSEQCFAAPSCFACGGTRQDIAAHTGSGTVFSWVVNHRAFGYEAETPFTVLLVELDGGGRVYGRLLEEGLRSELAGGEVVTLDSEATRIASYPVFSLSS